MAVVTGAASGIGEALTEALLARELDVVAIDRDVTTIDAAAHRFAVDVRNDAAMSAVAARFAGRPAAYVFANAGMKAGKGAGFALLASCGVLLVTLAVRAATLFL